MEYDFYLEQKYLHEGRVEARILTTAQYITNLLTEYFEMKKNGGNQIMANNSRTMAFQIPEDLFQRIKAHLERETARTGKKLTQREFVLGLIEEALNEAERQASVGPCEATRRHDNQTAQEAETMRTILEDFYFGNITPSERQMTPDSALARAVGHAARCEQQLNEQLNETERTLLAKLVNVQHEVNSITACENFVLGFRLGARIMAECMDEDDGNTQKVTDHA